MNRLPVRKVAQAICIVFAVLSSACTDPCAGWEISEFKRKDCKYVYLLRDKEGYWVSDPFDSQKDGEDLCIAASDAKDDSAKNRRRPTKGLPSPPYIRSFASRAVLEDFDEDGVEDLAVALESDDELAIHRGATPLAMPLRIPTGIGPMAIVAGDVNGDEEVDLITVNKGALGTGDLSLLLGNGDGSFEAPQPLSAGPMPTDLVLADLDGDQNLDLAVADLNTTQLTLRLGNGDGTFQSGLPIPTGRASGALTLADMNPAVDDHDDIVSGACVLLGNGDATFAAPIEYAITPGGVLRVAELNGDAHPDVIVVDRNQLLASVYPGIGDGTMSSPRHYVTGRFPDTIGVSDLDRDGTPDLTISSAQGDRVTLLGNGDGTFQGTSAYLTVPDLSRRQGAAGATVADFTGDGIPDVMVANGGNLQCSIANPCFGGQPAVLLPGLGDGRLGTRVEIPEQPGERVVSGDWDRDQQQDLAFVGRGPPSPQLFIVKGNGDGTFTASATINLPGNRLDALTASLDTAFLDAGDEPDLLVGNSGTDTVSVFIGNGTGGFVARSAVAVGPGAKSVAVGDFNGDQNSDLAISNAGNVNARDGTLKIALGNNDGTFAPAQTIRDGVEPDSVVAADFNRDGKLDLAASLEVSQFDWDVVVYLGNGDGSFAAPVSLGLTENLIHGVIVFDADRDGNPDLGVSDGGGAFLGFRGGGDGSFARLFRHPFGGGTTMSADLNQDGWPDGISASGTGFVAVRINTLPESGLLNPTLRILRAAQQVELSWPYALASFDLRESTNLQSWAPPVAPAQLTNGRFRTIIENVQGTRFFRLEHIP